MNKEASKQDDDENPPLLAVRVKRTEDSPDCVFDTVARLLQKNRFIPAFVKEDTETRITPGSLGVVYSFKGDQVTGLSIGYVSMNHGELYEVWTSDREGRHRFPYECYWSKVVSVNEKIKRSVLNEQIAKVESNLQPVSRKRNKENV